MAKFKVGDVAQEPEAGVDVVRTILAIFEVGGVEWYATTSAGLSKSPITWPCEAFDRTHTLRPDYVDGDIWLSADRLVAFRVFGDGRRMQRLQEHSLNSDRPERYESRYGPLAKLELREGVL